MEAIATTEYHPLVIDGKLIPDFYTHIEVTVYVDRRKSGKPVFILTSDVHDIVERFNSPHEIETYFKKLSLDGESEEV